MHLIECIKTITISLNNSSRCDKYKLYIIIARIIEMISMTFYIKKNHDNPIIINNLQTSNSNNNCTKYKTIYTLCYINMPWASHAKHSLASAWKFFFCLSTNVSKEVLNLPYNLPTYKVSKKPRFRKKCRSTFAAKDISIVIIIIILRQRMTSI